MTDDVQASHAQPRSTTVYVVLLALLGVSLVGPTFGIRVVTLVTAFGIAVVKAVMVAAYFMELNVERRTVWYLLLTMLAFMLVLFAGVAPDVMRDAGQNWRHTASVHTPAPPDGHGTEAPR